MDNFSNFDFKEAENRFYKDVCAAYKPKAIRIFLCCILLYLCFAIYGVFSDLKNYYIFLFIEGSILIALSLFLTAISSGEGLNTKCFIPFVIIAVALSQFTNFNNPYLTLIFCISISWAMFYMVYVFTSLKVKAWELTINELIKICSGYTYSFKDNKCGHEENVNLNGRQNSQSYADWFAAGLCKECYQAQKLAERKAYNEAEGLPEKS